MYRQLWLRYVIGRLDSRGMWNIMQTKDEKNNNNTELNTRYKIECKVNERANMCAKFEIFEWKKSLSDLHEL